MNRNTRALVATLALALLVCFGTSASASKSTVRNFSIAGGVISGKNGVALMRFDFTGSGVHTVHMYLAASNKYLTPTMGTSKYSVLKKNLVIPQTGGDVIIKSGTKYWTRLDPPVNYKPSGPHVFLALKVARNIPHTKQCVRINATGYTPPNGDLPAYSHFSPAGGGYCMSGKQWLKAGSN